MYGVSKITSDENIMLVSFSSAEPAFFAEVLSALAEKGVVVDMISQTTPYGSGISFSFTAPYTYFDTALKTIGSLSGGHSSPMVSGGYSKINLYGAEMVTSVGVAAKALSALSAQNIEIAMITTSDLDISLLLRREDEDVALQLLHQGFSL
ncbi:MAG: ACT domain-containing protein [Oscillospiraceae bacterium]